MQVNAAAAPPGSEATATVPGLSGEDFAAVFKSRERARSEHFSLHWRVGTAAVSRFGMVVAKRLTRTAIRRNLIKRQARALFALSLAQGQAASRPEGQDMPRAQGQAALRPRGPRDVVLRLTRNPKALGRSEQYAELQSLFAALDAPARGGS